MARRSARASRDAGGEGTGSLFEDPGAPPLYTVGQLSSVIHGRLSELGRVRVEGEVSQPKRMHSGHVYFDLKDAGARLACKVWQSKVRDVVRFELEGGAQVIAWGRLDVYPPQGGYSLIVDRLEALGLGALLAQLEARKAELAARGWFDRSRPLPSLPRTIGLVTSRDGAALRDFLRTRSLRWPGYPLRLAHTPVQGPGAAEAIAETIRVLDASGVDVIVVARGGGSLEDLWAFNELPVAQAIWESRVPVVTGVGHQTDTTLADLVADHRAHTPTDAAQTVIPDRARLCEGIARQGNYLTDALERLVAGREERLSTLAGRPVLRDAEWILGERARRLSSLRARLDSSLAGQLSRARAELAGQGARLERRSPRRELERRRRALESAGLRLGSLGPRTLERRESALGQAARALEGVSPLAVLARGYSMTRRADGPRAGEVLRDTSGLAAGERVETRLSRGAFVARIELVRPPGDPDAGPGADAQATRPAR